MAGNAFAIAAPIGILAGVALPGAIGGYVATAHAIALAVHSQDGANGLFWALIACLLTVTNGAITVHPGRVGGGADTEAELTTSAVGGPLTGCTDLTAAVGGRDALGAGIGVGIDAGVARTTVFAGDAVTQAVSRPSPLVKETTVTAGRAGLVNGAIQDATAPGPDVGTDGV